MVVTFSLSGAHAPNITREHAKPFPMHSSLHDTPSKLWKANKPANACWEYRGALGNYLSQVESMEQSTDSSTTCIFILMALECFVTLLLSFLLSTPLCHPTRPKKMVHFLSSIPLKVSLTICLSARHTPVFLLYILTANTDTDPMALTYKISSQVVDVKALT